MEWITTGSDAMTQARANFVISQVVLMYVIRSRSRSRERVFAIA